MTDPRATINAHQPQIDDNQTSANPTIDTSATNSTPYVPGNTSIPDQLPFDPPKKPDEVGMLGMYRVLKELGHGGMGAVDLAFDTHLKRQVAPKVMLPKSATMLGAKERFLRETRATAALKHEHIVTVYDADEDKGMPYMAIEYLQGMSLDDYLKQGSTAWVDIQKVSQSAVWNSRGKKGQDGYGNAIVDLSDWPCGKYPYRPFP